MNNGILEYVIGAIVDNGIRYWVGKNDDEWNKPELSSDLADAKRYDDLDELREDLETKLHPFAMAYKIIEIQRCPRCHREYTEASAISRKDCETAICPKCGVKEAVEAYIASRNK